MTAGERVSQLLADLAEVEADAAARRRLLPWEIGEIVGRISNSNERLALVRQLWHEKSIQSWVLAAAMIVGAPPRDEDRRKEWRTIGIRYVFRLRKQLTGEAHPCSTPGCNGVSLSVARRDGRRWSPYGREHGKCWNCSSFSSGYDVGAREFVPFREDKCTDFGDAPTTETRL